MEKIVIKLKLINARKCLKNKMQTKKNALKHQIFI